MDSIQILKERYLKNIKENPTVYIGIELEFPIVNCQGGATDTNVAKNLLKRLLEEYDFESERFDRDGNPIQLKSTKNEDRILFEVSYNTLETMKFKVKEFILSGQKMITIQLNIQDMKC